MATAQYPRIETPTASFNRRAVYRWVQMRTMKDSENQAYILNLSFMRKLDCFITYTRECAGDKKLVEISTESTHKMIKRKNKDLTFPFGTYLTFPRDSSLQQAANLLHRLSELL